MNQELDLELYLEVSWLEILFSNSSEKYSENFNPFFRWLKLLWTNWNRSWRRLNSLELDCYWIISLRLRLGGTKWIEWKFWMLKHPKIDLRTNKIGWKEYDLTYTFYETFSKIEMVLISPLNMWTLHHSEVTNLIFYYLFPKLIRIIL